MHVPGKAYNVADPVTKLIHTIGGGFFNEPKYYDTNRSYAEFMVELLTHRGALPHALRKALAHALAVQRRIVRELPLSSKNPGANS